eukprot:2168073-Rhodomonas_salina.2
MDICAIYSAVDMQLAKKVVGNVFRAQPSYYEDLNQALPFVQSALEQCSDSLLQLGAAAGGGGALDRDAAIDAALYLGDCSLTLVAMLRVHEEAAAPMLKSGIHLTAAASYERFAAATRKGQALAPPDVISEGLNRHVRGSLLELCKAILQTSLIRPLQLGRK